MNIKKVSILFLLAFNLSFNLFAMQQTFENVGVLPYYVDPNTNEKLVLLGQSDKNKFWNVFAGKKYPPGNAQQNAMQVFYDKTRGMYSNLNESDFQNFVKIQTPGFSDFTLFFVKVSYVPREHFFTKLPQNKTQAEITGYSWFNLNSLLFPRVNQEMLNILSKDFLNILNDGFVQTKLNQIQFSDLVYEGQKKKEDNFILWLGDIFKYNFQNYLLNDYFESHEQINFVVILYTNDGNILLKKDKRDDWSVFAGKFNRGQDPYDEASRLIYFYTWGVINLQTLPLTKTILINGNSPTLVFFVNALDLSNETNIPEGSLYECFSASDLQNAKYTVINRMGQNIRLFPSFIFTLKNSCVMQMLSYIDLLYREKEMEKYLENLLEF